VNSVYHLRMDCLNSSRVFYSQLIAQTIEYGYFLNGASVFWYRRI